MYGRDVFHLSLFMTVIQCISDLGCISVYVAELGVLTYNRDGQNFSYVSLYCKSLPH